MLCTAPVDVVWTAAVGRENVSPIKLMLVVAPAGVALTGVLVGEVVGAAGLSEPLPGLTPPGVGTVGRPGSLGRPERAGRPNRLGRLVRLGSRIPGRLAAAAAAGVGPVAAAGSGWLVPPVVAGAVVPVAVPASLC